MGLKLRNSNTQYVRISDGKFFLSTDKEKKQPFDELEGVLTDINIRTEEFEGKKTRKMYMLLVDGEDTYAVSCNVDSSYANTVIAFLKTVDLSRPLSLVPSLKKDGDDERRALLVKQDNKFAKSFYTKDNPNGQPPFKKVRFNGETKWDKTDYLEFMENVALNEIKPKLTKVASPAPSVTNKPIPQPTPVMSDGDEDFSDVEDDLPF